MSDEEWICGESWDHDLIVHYEDVTGISYWCKICEAEIWEPADLTVDSLSDKLTS